jgi:hypothetical protein
MRPVAPRENFKRIECHRERPNLSKDLARIAFLLAWVFLAGSVASVASLRAQSSATRETLVAPAVENPVGAPAAPPFWTNRGRWYFGAQIGYAVENAIPRNTSHINLLLAQPEVAFTALNFERFPVRRVDVVSQGILGNAIHPGGRMLGYAQLFRLRAKNYGRVVPFFELGAGVQHTTLYRRAPELTGALQFSPQAGPGVEYFFRPQRALVIQYRYMHVSNADIELPNLGFNASMLSIGFRWLRRPGPNDGPAASATRHPLRYVFGRN